MQWMIDGGTMKLRLNTVIPPSWIIEEELRRDKEKERKKRAQEPIPLRLPQPYYYDDAPYQSPKTDKEQQQERVVIIDL